MVLNDHTLKHPFGCDINVSTEVYYQEDKMTKDRLEPILVVKHPTINSSSSVLALDGFLPKSINTRSLFASWFILPT